MAVADQPARMGTCHLNCDHLREETESDLDDNEQLIVTLPGFYLGLLVWLGGKLKHCSEY
jgi:hypothetical protein